jgi:adenosylcobinamide-GDP ribazoletransferase
MSRSFSPHLGDIFTALSLLSRLPLPAAQVTPERLGPAAWAWPLAGALLGGLAALVAALALALGLPPAAAAGLALAAQVGATGGLHEDGLADSADGLWGGHSRARRLEIMKDSRIGSYGVLALTIGLGLRWTALAALMGSGAPWAALIGIGALSRLPMVSLARRLPQARPGGLSAQTGAPPAGAEALAAAVTALLALLLTGPAALPAALAVALATLAVARLAKARIGGQTGDILGAAQQVAEIAGLLALAAVLA